MFTPIDIQNKEFSKSFKGYKETEVDSFLDELTLDYEKLFRENIELKDKLGMMTEQVKHYSSIEQTIQKTLVMAQGTAEEVTLNARKKAELIIEDAEKDYKRKTESGNEELRKIKEEYERLRKEMMLYKTKCRSIISSQLAMIESELEEFSFGTTSSPEPEDVSDQEVVLEVGSEVISAESSEDLAIGKKEEIALKAELNESEESDSADDIYSTRRIDISEGISGA